MPQACAVRRPWRPRAAAPGVAILALTLGLAGCGTIPPPAAGGPVGTAPETTRPTTRPTPDATVGPSRMRTPPSPSGSGTTTARPSTAPPEPSPTRTVATPPPDTWVGHFRGRPVSVPRGHGARLSFTFDDGPWPGSTSQVLALLARYRVPAVFCLVGTQARVNPTLVRREVSGGHALCDHSRDHDERMAGRAQAYVDSEVADGLADVRRAAPRGTKVRFYRQPGGTWSPAVVKAMKVRHLDPLRWSDDPRDWSRPGSATIVRRVVARLHPGVVILLHDGGGDRSQTVEALRFLLPAVLAAGWSPVLAPRVPISDAAAAKPQ